MTKKILICSTTLKYDETDQYLLEKYSSPGMSRLKLLRLENWVQPTQSEELVSAYDNGDGVELEIGNKKIALDYRQVDELRILLSAMNKMGDNFSEKYFIGAESFD